MSFALPLSLHIGKWTECPLPLFCAAGSGGFGTGWDSRNTLKWLSCFRVA